MSSNRESFPSFHYGQVVNCTKAIHDGKSRRTIMCKHATYEDLIQIIVPSSLSPHPTKGDIVRFQCHDKPVDPLSPYSASISVKPSVLEFVRRNEGVEATITDVYASSRALGAQEDGDPDEGHFVVLNNSMFCPKKLFSSRGLQPFRRGSYLVWVVESIQSKACSWRVYDIQKFSGSSYCGPRHEDELVVCSEEHIDFEALKFGESRTKTLCLRNLDTAAVRILDTVALIGCPPEGFGCILLSDPYSPTEMESARSFFPTIFFVKPRSVHAVIGMNDVLYVDIKLNGVLPGQLCFYVIFQFNTCVRLKCEITASVLDQAGSICQSVVADPAFSPFQLKKRVQMGNRFRLKCLFDTLNNHKSCPFQTGSYQIPFELLHTLSDCSPTKKMSDIYPVLDEPLNVHNYQEKMHLLLHIEEYENLLELRNSDRVLSGRFEIAKKSKTIRLLVRLLDIEEDGSFLEEGCRVILYQQPENGKLWAVGGTIEGLINSCEIYVRLDAWERVGLLFSGIYSRVDLIIVLDRICFVRAHLAVDAIMNHRHKDLLCLEDLQNDELVRKQSDCFKMVGDFVSDGLNIDQANAVTGMVQGRSHLLPHILLGPPGTGKTSTLVQAILGIYLGEPDSRLLICAPSNVAVDNIGVLLVNSGKISEPLQKCVRLLARCRNLEAVPVDLRPFCRWQDERNFDPNCRLLLATCHTAFYASGYRFSHVFIDEAACATEPEALIPVTVTLAANGGTVRVILAGDPMQLGARVKSKVAEAYRLGKSLLSRLMEASPYLEKDNPDVFGPISRLRLNYRLPKSLLTMPSRLFYGSSLETMVPNPKFVTENIYETALNGCTFWPARAAEHHQLDTFSISNRREAHIVRKLVQILIDKGVQPTDIGVITPYTLQVKCIKTILKEAYPDWTPTVGTVDEYQGREKPYIILSTVRSKKAGVRLSERSLGFVRCPKRINVAITRAQRGLLIVGDPAALEVISGAESFEVDNRSIDVQCKQEKKEPHWRAIIRYLHARQRYAVDGLSEGAYPCPVLPKAKSEVVPQDALNVAKNIIERNLQSSRYRVRKLLTLSTVLLVVIWLCLHEILPATLMGLVNVLLM